MNLLMAELTPQQEINFQRESQERDIAANPNSIYADTMREDKVRNVIAQLNPELLLTEIEHRIRGEKKNHLTGEWEPISGSIVMSEELVQNYIAFLNVYLTQNNSLSNFSPNEINSIMEVVISYIRDDLSDNAERYGLSKRATIKQRVTVSLLEPYTDEDGVTSMVEKKMIVEQEIPVGEEITDYNAMTKIGHIVCQSTFSVLKQAQNGMLASRIFKALRVTESLNEGGKSKLVDAMKFW